MTDPTYEPIERTPEMVRAMYVALTDTESGRHYSARVRDGIDAVLDIVARSRSAGPAPAGDPTYVTVTVSRELLGQVRGKWSPPVQLQIVETPGWGTGWEMRGRTLPIGCAVAADPETPPVTTASGSHQIEKCKHGRIVSQCRCPVPNKRVDIVPCPQDCSADEAVARDDD
jgi:hypothetical protein